jgi:putative transposase
LVTEQRALLFGEVIEHEMRLSDSGLIVQDEWLRSESIRPDIALDEFVIMPNHLQAIIWIARKSSPPSDPADPHSRAPATGDPAGPHSRAPMPVRKPALVRKPRSLGSIVAGFKSATTKLINAGRSTPGLHVWQPNYHDRVIRNDYELERIRVYIAQNPERWGEDSLHQTP